MKVRKLFFLAAVAVFALCAGAGCKKENPGVEVGNPKIVGKIVELTTASGNYDYHVEIISQTQARVTQFTKTSPTPTLAKALTGSAVETITTTYTYSGGVLTFAATFSNQEKVDVIMNLDTNNKVVSAAVQINDQKVESTVEDKGGEETVDDSGSGGTSLAPSDFTRGVTADVRLPRND